METVSVCFFSFALKANFPYRRSYTGSRGSTNKHKFIYYGKFGDANQPTMDVSGLGEETPEAEEQRKPLQTHRAHTGQRRDSIPPTLEV